MRSRAHEKSGASRLNVGHSPATRVLSAQLGIAAVLAAAFWGMSGATAGYSALLGGLTCVVPNAFLALRLAAPRRDPGAGALLRAAWLGELGKLVLTVLMFGIVFTQVEPLAAGPLFAGFIGAQLMTLAGFLMRDGNGRLMQTSVTRMSKGNGD